MLQTKAAICGMDSPAKGPNWHLFLICFSISNLWNIIMMKFDVLATALTH